MLHYAIVFLIIALIAAFLGFGSLAGTAALIAKVCFVLFLIFAIVSFLKKRMGKKFVENPDRKSTEQPSKRALAIWGHNIA